MNSLNGMPEFTYSGLAWKVSEIYLTERDAIDGKISHVCTDKFEFNGKTDGELEQLRRHGYSVIVRKGGEV